MTIDFAFQFKNLTGYRPFPWQQRLYQQLLAGEVPSQCNIPTGLGKTSVIPIWLLALSAGSNVPRRLVYVVNRRTIVDQATDVVMRICDALASNTAMQGVATVLRSMNPLQSNGNPVLAVSTLRGELADNKQWKTYPLQPAIILGTVDMIGSKLLFNGYGDSRYARSLHAGLLGCDTLFVHDEAHLTPAFGTLLRQVEKMRHVKSIAPTIRVMDLSATPSNGDTCGSVVELNADDLQDEVVQARLSAKKYIKLCEVEKSGKQIQDKIVELALGYNTDAERVVIFVQKPDDAEKISEILSGTLEKLTIEGWKTAHPDERLSKKEEAKLKVQGCDRVSLLTGRIRGFERDQLLEQPAMLPFQGKIAAEKTVYFVATSAAEVGMDLHADQMVCDLSPLDSMIQRLGRVNRFGRSESRIDVVVEKTIDIKDPVRKAAKSFLAGQVNQGEINAGLSEVTGWLKDTRSTNAYTPSPEMVRLTDIQMDLFSMTSAGNLAARPEPEAWLHGIQDRQYPTTQIVWRAEVEQFSPKLSNVEIQIWFKENPIRSLERLQVPTFELNRTGSGKDWQRLFFKKLEDRKGITTEQKEHFRDLPVVIISSGGIVKRLTVGELIGTQEKRPVRADFGYATVILPASVGGLSARGFWDANECAVLSVMDVLSEAPDPPADRGVLRRDGYTWTYTSLGDGGQKSRGEWGTLTEVLKTLAGNQRVACKLQTILADELAVEDEVVEEWLILLKERAMTSVVSPASDVTVSAHQASVGEFAGELARAAKLKADFIEAFILAGKFHDEGKNCNFWQRAAGQIVGDPNGPFAKGTLKFNGRLLDGYRHEAGSLVVASDLKEIMEHPHVDLILHLIASHHGWARPALTPKAFGKQVSLERADELIREAMLRWERLQQKYGWWELAWFEALFKRADGIISADEIRDEI